MIPLCVCTLDSSTPIHRLYSIKKYTKLLKTATIDIICQDSRVFNAIFRDDVIAGLDQSNKQTPALSYQKCLCYFRGKNEFLKTYNYLLALIIYSFGFIQNLLKFFFF